MIAMATLFSVSCTCKNFYQCFAFHTTAQTDSVTNLQRPAERGRQICDQENLSPLGLAVLHRAKNLLVPISFNVCLKRVYIPTLHVQIMVWMF